MGLVVLEEGTVRAANARARQLLGASETLEGGALAQLVEALPGSEDGLEDLCAGRSACARGRTASAPHGLEFSTYGQRPQVVAVTPLDLQPSCAERVAHQINNALAGLVGATELLRAVGVEPRQERMVEMLERGLQGLRELSERLSQTGEV
ncbi:MAG: hypothetical protein R3F62_29170 [Planctomycetota bacterium]